MHRGIRIIASASPCVKTDRTKFSFQLAVVLSMSCATLTGGFWTSDVIGHLKMSLGIQMSLQMLVVSPSPILHFLYVRDRYMLIPKPLPCMCCILCSSHHVIFTGPRREAYAFEPLPGGSLLALIVLVLGTHVVFTPQVEHLLTCRPI